MLTIRAAQVAVFDEIAKGRFAEWMRGALRLACPDVTRGLDDAELVRRARLGIDRAAGYGVTQPGAVAAYVELMFRHGPKFDEHSAVRWALREQYPATWAVTRLDSTIPAAVWREVEAARTADDWRLLWER